MSQKIEHTGIITHIDEKIIQVSIIQKSACSSCHAKDACTASDMDEKIIDVEKTDNNYKTGDKVLLIGQSSTGLIAVLLAFVIPFLLILFTLFILRSYTDNEALSGTISLSVLIPYYLILSLFNKNLKNKFQFHIEKETDY
ncbi:MAG: SoxR reducing system RseC family protein [Paludibacter sp.]|nr:SoxR reducing system RseC family protein [Paludibacter sp.]